MRAAASYQRPTHHARGAGAPICPERTIRRRRYPSSGRRHPRRHPRRPAPGGAPAGPGEHGVRSRVVVFSHVCREQPPGRCAVPLPVCVLLVRTSPKSVDCTKTDRSSPQLPHDASNDRSSQPNPWLFPVSGSPDLGRCDHHPKPLKVSYRSFYSCRIQVADEQVGADVCGLLVDGSLVRADGLSEQLDHV